MLVVAACAMTASASSVNWGLATGDTLDSTKVDAGTAYLMYSIGTVDFSKLATMDKFDASSLATVGLDTTIDTFAYSSSKVSSTVSVTPTGTKTSANQNIGLLSNMIIGKNPAADCGGIFFAYNCAFYSKPDSKRYE